MQNTTSTYSENERLSSTIRTLVPIRLRIGMRHENETDIGEIAHPIRVGIEFGEAYLERSAEASTSGTQGSGFSPEQCVIWGTSANTTRTTH